MPKFMQLRKIKFISPERYKIISFFLFILLILDLFSSNEEIGVIEIPISMTALAMLFLFILLMYLLFIRCMNRKIYGDMIFFFLCLRFAILTVMQIEYPSSDYLFTYASSFIVCILYLCVINCTPSFELLLKICEIASVIIFLQTLVVTISALGKFTNLAFLKSNIVIPIGGSNFISSFVLLFFPIVTLLEQNTVIKRILIFINISTILLTRTTSGVIVLLFLIIIITLSNRSNIRLLLYIIAITILSMLLIKYYSPDYFDRLVLAITGEASTSSTLNGRTVIYKKLIELIKMYPFGVGVYYRTLMDGAAAHNWFLENLIMGGPIFLILQLGIWVACLKEVFSRMKYDRRYYCISLSVIGAILQGLVEPNFGSIRFDYFLYIIIGIGTSINISNGYLRKRI